jgi:hypothetical protein
MSESVIGGLYLNGKANSTTSKASILIHTLATALLMHLLLSNIVTQVGQVN